MQCRRLLLEIYNFLDYIRGLAEVPEKAPLLKELNKLNEAGLRFRSLHSKNPKGSSSKASGKRSDKTGGKS